FYATLFGATPVGNTYTAGIAAARVQHYQQIAASVVNDSASTWNIGEFEPQAGFGYSALGNGLFQFTDQSDNAQSISWDFGDGGVSTQASPSHTYTATGIYTVTQVVSDGCTSDTSVQTVNVSLIGIEEAESVDILVFPNPVADMLRVRFNGQVVPERWALYTFDGRLAMEGRFTGQADAVLDLSALPAGSYELLLQQGDKRFRKSLFKR
ncbi:MAG TPA: PKD domain-containing protein, partial [Bacteroidia bacterium]|nr:PKD domain-containing protein [Bacteroidia bacterium]